MAGYVCHDEGERTVGHWHEVVVVAADLSAGDVQPRDLETREVGYPRGQEPALDVAGDANEVMVIGGGQVYRDFLPRADRIYMTRVQAEVQGDAFFPGIDGNGWRLVSAEHHAADEKHEYPFEMMVFERRPA